MNDLLFLKLRNAIVDKEVIVATMNMETQNRSGWSSDWRAAFTLADNEVTFILLEILKYG